MDVDVFRDRIHDLLAPLSNRDDSPVGGRLAAALLVRAVGCVNVAAELEDARAAPVLGVAEWAVSAAEALVPKRELGELERYRARHMVEIMDRLVDAFRPRPEYWPSRERLAAGLPGVATLAGKIIQGEGAAAAN